ncbi:MAG: alpha-1,2-fucosyltransferase [Candidatus Nanopelagicales bacterium]|nr:alpha-1,2-fucosyltransferase [Candidatus Nanopelagicales bacterium]
MSELANVTRSGITAKLSGGLGNQLFEYAAARGVAARLKCPVFLDTSELSRVGPEDTSREFELSWLVDATQVIDLGYSSVGRIRAAVGRRVPALLPRDTFKERGFEYDSRITQVRVGAVLSGYFQSPRYFENIAGELRRDIQVHIPHSLWRTQTSEKLDALGPWIALHVRRGDYMEARNSAFHGLLMRPYYERAIQSLNDRGVAGRIVIFSDDPPEAIRMLGPIAVDALVVEPANEADAAESIALMSKATAVITANSSFSWWAAWLGDPDETVVICPTPWLRNSGLDERDLRPSSWISIDAGFEES